MRQAMKQGGNTVSEPVKVNEELEEQRGALAKLPPPLLRQFADMAMLLPETEQDGGAAIIDAILNTVDVQELDAPWDDKDPEALWNRWLVITDASRSPSEYEDGLGVFLVVQAHDEEEGTDITFTTGSVGVVAQIVRAYANDDLPLRAKIVPAKKRTRRGYLPTHLVIHKNQPGK